MEAHTSATRRISARGIASWVLAGFVFFAVLEVCARVEDRVVWGAPWLGPHSFDALFGADSIGWRPRPEARFRQFTINSHGFRGPETEFEAGPGVVRVVVLGASESFGQAESEGAEYPRALERRLNDLARGAEGEYEVINAAIPGMSLPRAVEYYDRWVGRFDPDIVVVYPSPGFYLDEFAPADSIARRSGGFTPPEGGPRLQSRLRSALEAFVPAGLQTILKEREIKSVREERGAEWAWSEVPEDRLDLYEAHLLRLISTLEASGAEIVLATHVSAIEPPLDQREEQLLVGWQRFHPRADGEVILQFERRANSRLRAVGEGLGVQVIDLARELSPEPTWFSDHQHFSDVGADSVAAVVAKSVSGSRIENP